MLLVILLTETAGIKANQGYHAIPPLKMLVFFYTTGTSSQRETLLETGLMTQASLPLPGFALLLLSLTVLEKCAPSVSDTLWEHSLTG